LHNRPRSRRRRRTRTDMETLKSCLDGCDSIPVRNGTRPKKPTSHSVWW